MSSNALPYTVASIGIVCVADIVSEDGISGQQILGSVIYLFAMSMVNMWNRDLASSFALLVLVGVALTKGYKLITALDKVI